MRASVPSQFAMPSASPSDRSEVRARRPRQRDETNASIAFCSLASSSKILLRTVSPSPPCCSAASRRLAARPVAAARADRDPSAVCMRPVAKRRAKSLIHRHERALRTESASGLGLQQELQFRRQGAAAAKSAELPTCPPAGRHKPGQCRSRPGGCAVRSGHVVNAGALVRAKSESAPQASAQASRPQPSLARTPRRAPRGHGSC